MEEMEYAGFWIRVAAALIDTLLIFMIIGPFLTLIYGKDYWYGETFLYGFWDLMFSYILPAIAVIVFWSYKSATPGKMALKLSIVDAKSGGNPTTGQLIGRYLGYYLSSIPLGLGLIWVGIDRKKQGWHDKIVGTVVVRNLKREKVEFEIQP